MSIREFCRQRRLRESQFYWWQRKLKVGRQERRIAKPGSGSWTRVIQLRKTDFMFKTLRHPLHRQFLALFRAVEKIKVD
jgi:hypothetical protein